MIVEAKNVFSVVKSSMNDKERAVFARVTTMPDGKKLAKLVKNEYIFPTGLMRRLYNDLKEHRETLSIVDKRVKPNGTIYLERFSWARDYQYDALASAFEKTRGIISAGTGAGKGEMAVAFPIVAPSLRWLYVAPRQVLVDDVANRYHKRCGKKVHELAENVKPGLTVSTMQGLARKVKELDPNTMVALKQFDGYIIDEAHQVASPTFARIGYNMKNAYYRIGLSATPLDRSDGKSLAVVGSTGEIIFEIKAHELIARGALTPMRVKWIKCKHSWETKDWRTVLKENICNNVYRNRLITQVVKWDAPKPCIVFAEQKEHARILAELLDAELVDGDSPNVERQRIINSAKARETGIIVATRVFSEGIDIPTLNSVVIASGGKSVISVIQRIGRGSRLSEGKTECTVYDVRDMGERYTSRHTREREKTYTREKIPQEEFNLEDIDELE